MAAIFQEVSVSASIDPDADADETDFVVLYFDHVEISYLIFFNFSSLLFVYLNDLYHTFPRMPNRTKFGS
jgi:hypothetical protein